MPEESEIQREVFSILSEIAPEVESVADIDVDANLREQVDLDSMDFLNLLTALSTRFKIDIPVKNYGKLTSFSDLVNYVRQNSG